MNIKAENNPYECRSDSNTASSHCTRCNVEIEGEKKVQDLHYRNYLWNRGKSADCASASTSSSFLVHQPIPDPDKAHQCDVCEKSYATVTDLQKHKLSHDFQCEICLKRFAKFGNLRGHMRSHEQHGSPHYAYGRNLLQRTSATSNDDTDFNTRAQQRVPLARLRNGGKPHVYDLRAGHKPFKCDLCDKKFSLVQDLRKHIAKSHSPDEPFKYPVCNDIYKQVHQTAEHDKHTERSTHDERQHTTYDQPHHTMYDEPHHTTYDEPHHTTHDKRHRASRDRPRKPEPTQSDNGIHECEICGKTFTRSGHLQDHMQVHRGRKMLQCDMCSARYWNLNELLDHARTHNAHQPGVECGVCGKRFKTGGELRSHMKLHRRAKKTKSRRRSVEFERQPQMACGSSWENKIKSIISRSRSKKK